MMNQICTWNDSRDLAQKNPVMHENFKFAGCWDDDIDQIWWVPEHMIDEFMSTNEFKLNRHGPPVEFPFGIGSFFVDYHS